MDLDDPTIVVSRTIEPIMVPTENYELSGFFGYVVFTNGHVVNGDKLTIYYGQPMSLFVAQIFLSSRS